MCVPVRVCVCVLIMSCLTLFDPVDCSLLGSSVHGILQARYWSGCHALLQGIVLTQGSNSCLLCLLQGSKRSRRKANSKVPGRSPLTVLQDDNSPGALTPRQVKGERVKAVTRKSRVMMGAFSPPSLLSPNSFLPSLTLPYAFCRVSSLP